MIYMVIVSKNSTILTSICFELAKTKNSDRKELDNHNKTNVEKLEKVLFDFHNNVNARIGKRILRIGHRIEFRKTSSKQPLRNA